MVATAVVPAIPVAAVTVTAAVPVAAVTVTAAIPVAPAIATVPITTIRITAVAIAAAVAVTDPIVAALAAVSAETRPILSPLIDGRGRRHGLGRTRRLTGDGRLARLAPVTLRPAAPLSLAAAVALRAVTLLQAILAPGAVLPVLGQGGTSAGQEDDGQGRHGDFHFNSSVWPMRPQVPWFAA